MEFTAKRKVLHAAALTAAAVADRKNPNPILTHALIRAAEGAAGVSLTATDLSITVDANISPDNAKVRAAGGVCVPAKLFADILRGLPGDDVSLKLLPNAHIEVKSLKSTYKVLALPEKNYPAMPALTFEWKDVSAALFRGLIASVAHAIGDDETRPQLCGALFLATKGVAAMTATDGHRLARVVKGYGPPGSADLFKGEAFILPRVGLKELVKLLDTVPPASGEEGGPTGFVKLAFNGTVFAAQVGSVRFTMKALDVKFPPWDKVVPEKERRRVIVDREALEAAIGRISIFASGTTRVLRFEVKKEEMVISSDSPELGDGREVVPATFNGPKPVVFGVSAKYLSDAIESTKHWPSGDAEDEGDVVLDIEDELDPIVIKTAAVTCVVMPMRL